MIRFGGSDGFVVKTVNFDTKEFDCGTDYRLFINRIDQVCRKNKISTEICNLQDLQNDLNNQMGGDCIQRIDINAREMRLNVQFEAVRGCVSIDELNYSDALLKAPELECDVPIKAIEITFTLSGYGEGKEIAKNPQNIVDTIMNRLSIEDAIENIISQVENQIVSNYDYNAPIDDFHTFNISLRGVYVPKGGTLYEIPQACEPQHSRIISSRYTFRFDLTSGRANEEIETTVMGEFENVSEALDNIDVECL